MYASFALPAFIVWGLISVVLHSIPDDFGVRLAIAIVALIAGAREIRGRRTALYSSGWQVPSQWVKGKPFWRQSLTWGAFLGPGFITRNPLAGTWLLTAALILLTHTFGLPPFLIGGMIGVLQSSGRVSGIRWQIRNGRVDHIRGIIREMRARRVDGGFLVLLGAVLLASLAVT
jgi:hypothetical protein